MSLEQFGWNSHFENEFTRVSEAGSEPARVAQADRERFVVWREAGESEAVIGGALRHRSEDWPAVGDWIVLESGCRIARVLARQTAFSRKQAGAITRQQVIAANIDVLFVVSGLDGDFNPRRIERYLLLAWESGAKPVVVLNKADVCADVAEAAASVAALASGAPVLAVSALENWGVAALEEHLQPGRTAAVAGSSGAGKSTLINCLLGREQQRVQKVRAGDSRGRHTTVRRELFLARDGWLLIDTPGLRELQLWAGADSMDATFSDIAALASGCRFRDCRHQGEPGCAVAASGIDQARLANYTKMQRELAHLDRKLDQRAAQDEKRRIKRIHRAMRGMNRM
jgi:ribosome biogenesis GTPase / thiamine phosphate phosphatase